MDGHTILGCQICMTALCKLYKEETVVSDIDKTHPMVPDLIEDEELPDFILGYTEENSAAPLDYDKEFTDTHGFTPDWKEVEHESTPAENEIELQQVWRTASTSNNSGYFVWDIIEVIGEVDPKDSWSKQFTLCRDGSYILVQCYHFWTTEKSNKFLNESGGWAYQTVIIIP